MKAIFALVLGLHIPIAASEMLYREEISAGGLDR